MIRPAVALALVALLCSACDETDAVAVRVQLKDDLSGSVRTSGLALPAGEGAIQQASEGAVWGSRVQMICATGTFADVTKLKVADIAFNAGTGGQGIGFAQVSIPRGPGVRWPGAFVPLSADERKSVASALDPTGRSEAVGATIKIEVELPSAVVGNGVIGKVRGTKTTTEGPVATLVIPVEAMTAEGDPLVWHLTWQK